MAFNDILKNIMKEEKLTYSDIAHMLGKTEGAIRAWGTGRTKPDIDTLTELAKKLNVTSDYLLGLSEFKNPVNKEIIEELGLSDKSIEFLKALNNMESDLHWSIKDRCSIQNALNIILEFGGNPLVSIGDYFELEEGNKPITITTSGENIKLPGDVAMLALIQTSIEGVKESLKNRPSTIKGKQP